MRGESSALGVFDIIGAIFFGVAAFISSVHFIDYRTNGSVTYDYCLAFLLMIIAIALAITTILNMVQSIKIYRFSGNPWFGRAYYLFGSYGLMYLVFIISTASQDFVTGTIIGFPIYLIGCVLYSYQGYRLLSPISPGKENGTYLQSCTGCGSPFMSDWKFHGKACPRCESAPVWYGRFDRRGPGYNLERYWKRTTHGYVSRDHDSPSKAARQGNEGQDQGSVQQDRTVHKAKCPGCQSNFLIPADRLPPYFACPRCTDPFTSDLVHIMMCLEGGGTPYGCPVCSYRNGLHSFTSEDEVRISCDHCLTVFRLKPELRIDLSASKDDLRLMLCPECHLMDSYSVKGATAVKCQRCRTVLLETSDVGDKTDSDEAPPSEASVEEKEITGAEEHAGPDGENPEKDMP